jgi:hypothetical protein
MSFYILSFSLAQFISVLFRSVFFRKSSIPYGPYVRMLCMEGPEKLSPQESEEVEHLWHQKKLGGRRILIKFV